MNISCSSRGLPATGCLFFKVLGKTNTTECEKQSINLHHSYNCSMHNLSYLDKFNRTVPGTLADAHLNDAELVTSADTQPETRTFTPDAMVSTTEEKSPIDSTLIVPGSALLYTVIGVSSGFILTFSFTVVCVLVSVSVAMKAKSRRHTSTSTLERLNGIASYYT